jgi:hypothetical protein
MKILSLISFFFLSASLFSQEPTCEKMPVEELIKNEEVSKEIDDLVKNGDLKTISVCQTQDEIILESDEPVPTRHLVQIGGYLGMFFGAEIAYGQLKASGIPQFRLSLAQEANLGANSTRLKYEYYPFKKLPLYTGLNGRMMTTGSGNKEISVGGQVGIATTKFWINPSFEIGYNYYQGINPNVPSFSGFLPDFSLGIRVNLYRTKK